LFNSLLGHHYHNFINVGLFQEGSEGMKKKGALSQQAKLFRFTKTPTFTCCRQNHSHLKGIVLGIRLPHFKRNLLVNTRIGLSLPFTMGRGTMRTVPTK
jgi:hypothetical protein